MGFPVPQGTVRFLQNVEHGIVVTVEDHATSMTTIPHCLIYSQMNRVHIVTFKPLGK